MEGEEESGVVKGEGVGKGVDLRREPSDGYAAGRLSC